MRIRAVLFDANGILIQPRESIGETYARILEQYGVRLPAWRLEDGLRRILARNPFVALPGRRPEETQAAERLWWRERVRETIQAVDSTAALSDFQAAFSALFDHYASPEAWQLDPNARETLEQIRARQCANGIVSNFDFRLIGILEGLGIAELLETISIPSRSGFVKPDARAFAYALEQLGVGASETVFVGHDPVADGLGAQAAGILGISIPPHQSLLSVPTRIDEIATFNT